MTKKKKFAGCLLALCAVVFFAYRLNFFSSSYIDSLSSFCVYPVLVMQRTLVAPLNSWLSERKTIQELKQQLQDLRAQYEELQAQTIALRTTHHYAQDIQELIDFQQRFTDAHGCVAQVLAQHFSDQAHYLYVNAGSRAGIRPDMVAVYNNCLVGKVSEVFPWYSKVVLITDACCKVAAYCATTNTHGIHEGLNKYGESSLQHVSHLTNVAVGDLVISSGKGLVFPQGFALGKITMAQQEGLFHRITVEPLIDVRSIDYCLLLAKENVRS